MSNGYNGWSNYETWLVNLWFGNMFADMVEFDAEASADSFRDAVDNYLEDGGEMGSQSGFVADCVNSVVGSVNWREIAEHYVEEEESEDA